VTTPGPATAAGPRRTVRAARSLGSWRWPVLAFLAVVLVGAGLIDAAVGSGVPPTPATLASAGAPDGSESSSWYCTGGTGGSGAAGATVELVNSGGQAVSGTVTVVNDQGASGTAPVTVPAGGQVAVATDQVEQGNWLAAAVDLNGGGVVASEIVEGSTGWAQAPCASTTASDWYFASGATNNGSLLYVSLFNPTSTVSVVNLAFVTPRGLVRPQPFEGLVVDPGQLVVAGVASFVQGASSVSTIVQAGSGRVVASELEVHNVGGRSGLSLRLGSPVTENEWSVPRTIYVTGTATTLEIFNPTAVPEKVTVTVQLPSGPVSPFEQQLAADTTWSLVTSSSTRIPAGTDFATTVRASGGSGVVVDRVVTGPTAGVVPQWGAVSAVGQAAGEIESRQWILPSLDAPATPAEAGAKPFALALQNLGTGDVTVSVGRITPSGIQPLAGLPELRIPGGAFTVVEPTTLGKEGSDPLVVRASGPLSAMEDGVPAAMPGVVALAGIPQRT
jgi:Family of unknown function (DUF5719)